MPEASSSHPSDTVISSWTSASPGASIVFDRTTRPELSVVTVTYGTGQVLLRSMASLAASLTADDIDAELIVVDHAHPRRRRSTSQMLRLATSGVRVLSVGRNLGFGGGNELGIACARGATICLMNPDVFVAPGSIPALLGVLHEHPNAVVTPTLLNTDGSVQERGQQLDHHGTTHPLIDAPATEGLIELRHDQFASAACWFLRRELHERVGGFDPAYQPAYYEDADYAMRVRASGGRILVARDVDVVHVRGGSTDGPPPDTTRQRRVFTERWGRQLGWDLTRAP